MTDSERLARIENKLDDLNGHLFIGKESINGRLVKIETWFTIPVAILTILSIVLSSYSAFSVIKQQISKNNSNLIINEKSLALLSDK